MNGIGNEIVVLDLRDAGDATVSGRDARAIGRSVGLLYDQLMVIGRANDAAHDARLTIFNIDGSRAEACGNGTRCVAAALARGTPARFSFESDAGLLDVRYESDDVITVDMGAPLLAWDAVPLAHVADTAHVRLEPAIAGLPTHFAAVGMGNPHAVFFVPNADAVDLACLGPIVEHHPLFPAQVNASFAERIDDTLLRLRVWERGAGATRACGTAACATLVAASRTGLTGRDAVVALPGGDLRIVWRERDDHVLMTGPAEFEFERPLDPNVFATATA